MPVQSPILDSVPYPSGTFLSEGTCLAESTASALELITSICHLLSGTLCPVDSDPVHWHWEQCSLASCCRQLLGLNPQWPLPLWVLDTLPAGPAHSPDLTAGPTTQTHYPYTHKTTPIPQQGRLRFSKIHPQASSVPCGKQGSRFTFLEGSHRPGRREVPQGDQMDSLEQTQEGVLPGDGQQGRRRGRMGGAHTGGDWPFE